MLLVLTRIASGNVQPEKMRKKTRIIGDMAIAMAVRGTSVEIIMPMLSAQRLTIMMVTKKMKNLPASACSPVIQYL